MKRKAFYWVGLFILTLGINSCNGNLLKLAKVHPSERAMDYLVQIADEEDGIGAREASTEKEIETGNWIYDKLTGFGYSNVIVQPFDYHSEASQTDKISSSNNYIVEKKGKQDKTVILVAHYDSTGSKSGSLGAIINRT